MQKTLYVGLDVHKASISVTVAEDGREGKVNFVGTIPNSPIALTKLAKKLAKGGHRLEFCYEAGCCGYGIYRHLTALGQATPAEQQPTLFTLREDRRRPASATPPSVIVSRACSLCWSAAVETVPHEPILCHALGTS